MPISASECEWFMRLLEKVMEILLDFQDVARPQGPGVRDIPLIRWLVYRRRW